MKHYALMIAFVVLAQWAFSQDQNLIKYANTITQDDLKKHLSIIASDTYEGRNTGDKGLEMAAKYIETEFVGDKLIGPDAAAKDPFYQEFELEKKSWPKAKFTIGKSNLENGKNISFITLAEGVSEYDLVFIGYGIYSEKYNDYKDIDVKGKVVVFLMDEPKTNAGKYLVTGTAEPSIKKDTTLEGRFNAIQPKATALLMRGAKGFIAIDSDPKEAT